MKKKLLCLIFASFMLISLSGCECSHRWSEADCLNASACSKCGEVQGEALGHDWVGADCDTPESCSRCADTRGEALGHSFGGWLVHETDMSRSCSVCGHEEHSDIDRELVVAQLLEGQWNFWFCMANDMLLYYSDFPMGCFCGNFTFLPGNCGVYSKTIVLENGSFEVRDFDFNWKLIEYTVDKTESYEFDEYIIEASFDGWSRTLKLSPGAGGILGKDLGLLEIGPGEVNLFFKTPEEAEYLAGKWEFTDFDGNVASFELREDGSFISDLYGELSGTWYASPLRSHSFGENSDYSLGMYLRFEKDGVETIWSGYEYIYGVMGRDYKDLLSANRAHSSLSVGSGNGRIGSFTRAGS